MVEDEIVEKYDRWKDEEFVNEMLRREKGFLDGTSKRYTLEEVVTSVRKKLKKII